MPLPRSTSSVSEAVSFPEFAQPNLRELLVQRYRLLYEVTPSEIHILAFIHGARDLTRRQLGR
jgi:plasmid stabilization system protein ParE